MPPLKTLALNTLKPKPLTRTLLTLTLLIPMFKYHPLQNRFARGNLNFSLFVSDFYPLLIVAYHTAMTTTLLSPRPLFGDMTKKRKKRSCSNGKWCRQFFFLFSHGAESALDCCSMFARGKLLCFGRYDHPSRLFVKGIMDWERRLHASGAVYAREKKSVVVQKVYTFGRKKSDLEN